MVAAEGKGAGTGGNVARVCTGSSKGIGAGVGGIHGLTVGPGEGEGEGITAGISGPVGGFHCEIEGETGSLWIGHSVV